MKKNESVGIDITKRSPLPGERYNSPGDYRSDPIMDCYGNPTGLIRLVPSGAIVSVNGNIPVFHDIKDNPGIPEFLVSLIKKKLIEAYIDRRNIMFLSPFGWGVTSLASRCHTSLFPPLGKEVRKEVNRTYYKAGILPIDGDRGPFAPFRAPHHTISGAGMEGTKKLPYGELQLADHGVLYLDEVQEFSHGVLGAVKYRKPKNIWIMGRAMPCICYCRGYSHCECLPTHKQRWVDRIHRMTGDIFHTIIDLTGELK